MRQRLGDAAFFRMLKELRRRYEFKTVSTDELQGLMQEFLPPRGAEAIAEIFFDNWVHATGVPQLQVRSSNSGRAPNVKVTGTVTQRDAPEGFEIDVPVEVQMPKGEPRIVWVRTGEGPTAFTLTVPQAPKAVGIAAGAVLMK
jgi:aminopeptidase N